MKIKIVALWFQNYPVFYPEKNLPLSMVFGKIRPRLPLPVHVIKDMAFSARNFAGRLLDGELTKENSQERFKR